MNFKTHKFKPTIDNCLWNLVRCAFKLPSFLKTQGQYSQAKFLPSDSSNEWTLLMWIFKFPRCRHDCKNVRIKINKLDPWPNGRRGWGSVQFLWKAGKNYEQCFSRSGPPLRTLLCLHQGSHRYHFQCLWFDVARTFVSHYQHLQPLRHHVWKAKF